MNQYQKLVIVGIFGSTGIAYAVDTPAPAEEQLDANGQATTINQQPITRTPPQRNGVGTSTTTSGGLGGGTSGSTGTFSSQKTATLGGATSGSMGDGSYNQSGALGGGSSGSTGTGSFIGAKPIPEPEKAPASIDLPITKSKKK